MIIDQVVYICDAFRKQTRQAFNNNNIKYKCF